MTFPIDRIDFAVLGMFADAARIRAGLSIGALAKICDVPPDDIHRVIRGRGIGREALEAICRWLDRSPEFFLHDDLKSRRMAYL
ncbi:helix-turn-helix domain-containing protein [Phyllobacterium phragmitis]|uniref:helix-turn-helix domain-containing protein n=1 Tax=Phyllobacterium phragmitis TaxID=2670329 RepID=UPI001AECDDE9|nr:helix-turn-helix domain-containing protein [Phyllobacterium phragmitis]